MPEEYLTAAQVSSRLQSTQEWVLEHLRPCAALNLPGAEPAGGPRWRYSDVITHLRKLQEEREQAERTARRAVRKAS